MKIALIGTRGIPASHGGFETCVEEIGWRLAEKGHSVTVYSKKGKYKSKRYRGMKIVFIPRVPIKGFETLFASILAVIHSLIFRRFDFHMVFDNANAPALLFYKLLGSAYAINTDGLGWQRDKWGKFAKKYYKWSELVCVQLCKNIVTDSVGMQEYYMREYGASSNMIEYGANLPPKVAGEKSKEMLALMGLKSKQYFLQVTRFEPENDPLLSLQAIRRSDTNFRMVLVGGAPLPTSYSKSLEKEVEKSSKIILPGFIYDPEILSILWQNCLAYIHGNHIGGTNPALLQAMAAGRPIIARDCIFNREVLENNGYYYERNIDSLLESMNILTQNLQESEEKAQRAFQKVKAYYTWERISDAYENLFNKILHKS